MIRQFHDRTALSGSSREILNNGFMRVPAKIARTGIQIYLAGEMGLEGRPATDQIRVWRPSSEVFSTESLASFASKPMTDDHPPGDVTAENARALSVGWSGENIGKNPDGIHVDANLIVADKAVQAKIEAGKVEISNGYLSDLVIESGVVPAGENDAGQTYDAIQRNIRGNHIALVGAGRCGPSCSVADHAPPAEQRCTCSGVSTMADPALKMMLVDGFSVQVTDQAEAAINRINAQLTDAKATLVLAQTGLNTAQAKYDTDTKVLNDQIADLKGKIPDAAALDAMVSSRVKLIVDARRIGGADVKVDGVKDADIRRAVVGKKLGDPYVQGKEDAYVLAAFDMLVAQAPASGGGTGQGATGDPVRDAMFSPHYANPTTDARETTWTKATADLENAWRKPVAA